MRFSGRTTTVFRTSWLHSSPLKVIPGDVLHMAGNLAAPTVPWSRHMSDARRPKRGSPRLVPESVRPRPKDDRPFADMGFSVRGLMALIGAHNGKAATFRLNSDVNFSHDPITVQDYNRFVGEAGRLGSEYGYDTSTLTDCTGVLPQMIDLKNLAMWLSNSGKQTAEPTIDRTKLETAIQQYQSPVTCQIDHSSFHFG
ncbi:hypothetical protein B0H19DRAFT_1252390 [Mycena capillaripes]|nr:hypothetical protein B0H19DRAFT_1252390 [Mycena capillaripes]